MTSTTTILTSLISALLGSAGLGVIVHAFANRKVIKSEVAERLNDSTLEWAEALKADTREARADAREARVDAAECRRVMEEIRQRFDRTVGDQRELRAAIWATDATIDRLREVIVRQTGLV